MAVEGNLVEMGALVGAGLACTGMGGARSVSVMSSATIFPARCAIRPPRVGKRRRCSSVLLCGSARDLLVSRCLAPHVRTVAASGVKPDIRRFRPVLTSCPGVP